MSAPDESGHPNVGLLEVDSPADLVLRGYRRDAVLAATGYDVGYNGHSIKRELAGIDRNEYRLAHVSQRVSDESITAMLDGYGRGQLSGEQALDALGLANPTLVALKKVFAELNGGVWVERFTDADRSRRKATMRAGMVATYGTDNPFKLTEFQEQAKATRIDRFGAPYTLAAGSSLIEAAREKMRVDMEDPAIKARIVEDRRVTLRKNWGVDSPIHSPEIRANGVPSALCLPENREPQDRRRECPGLREKGVGLSNNNNHHEQQSGEDDGHAVRDPHR